MNRPLFRPVLTVIVAALLLCGALTFGSCSMAQNGKSPSWRSGIFTSLSLSLDSDGNRISAVARNDLTVGFSTIPVYVYLYASAERTDDYAKMQLLSQESADNLNLFASLSASADLTGNRLYYVARLRYKDSNGAWQDVATKPTAFSRA